MTKIMTVAALLIAALAGSATGESLTLQQCLDSAARNNQALRASSYDLRIATQSEKIAASGYLPRIDTKGGYTMQLEPQAMSTGNGSVRTQQADYAFFSVGLDQTLYDFGRTASRVERSKAQSEATRQGYRAQEQDLFLRVVQSFYGILETERFLAAADEEVQQMAGHLKDADSKFEQGVVTRNDVLQAEVKLANSRQRRLDIARQLDNNWLLLDYLTGRGTQPHATLVDAGQDKELPPREVAASDLARRPDLLQAQGEAAASRANVQEQGAAFRPEFYFHAGADYVQNSYLKEETIMAATVGVRFNIFEGGATSARLRQAVEARSQSEEKLRQAEEAALLEYRTAQNDVRVALERIATTERAIGQAEENLRLNRGRYEEQMGTSTEVIDAQTLLTQARTDFFQAHFDARVAQARVKKALGNL